MRKQTPETALKRRCSQLLKMFGGYSLPIPGGAYGVRGAPDRIIFYKERVWPAEFKAPGKNLSPAQREVREKIEATGCKYLVIRREEDLIEALGLPVRGLW